MSRFRFTFPTSYSLFLLFDSLVFPCVCNDGLLAFMLIQFHRLQGAQAIFQGRSRASFRIKQSRDGDFWSSQGMLFIFSFTYFWVSQFPSSLIYYLLFPHYNRTWKCVKMPYLLFFQYTKQTFPISSPSNILFTLKPGYSFFRTPWVNLPWVRFCACGPRS